MRRPLLHSSQRLPVLLKPILAPSRGLLRELDTNNDGVPDTVENLPARGALRASNGSGVLTLRWRPASADDKLETA